jgi:hypothetical protein
MRLLNLSKPVSVGAKHDPRYRTKDVILCEPFCLIELVGFVQFKCAIRMHRPML